MKKNKISTTAFLRAFGLDYKKMRRAFRGNRLFWADYKKLKAEMGSEASVFPFGRFQFCLEDRFDEGGTAKGHYFHQDLMVARRIYQKQPNRHVDVGSRIDGFVAHLAVFREVEVIDIRDLTSQIENIVFKQVDMMSELDQAFVEYTDSISCLHALEHFGLGRYGDPICADGYKRGLRNLTQMLKPGGRFYFSVPIGRQQIEFNAHRVFSLPYIRSLLEPDYNLECFSYVDDAGDLHENASASDEAAEVSFECNFGCGIFELIKK